MTEIERIAVTQRELIDIGKHLRRQCIYYISGSYSIYVQSERKKYLNQAVLKPWPDMDGDNVRMLPGEAARMELKKEWPDLKRIGWSAPMIRLFDKCPPMHYTGTQKGEFIQIDLSGAYWQIYRRLWLDTSWPGGYYGRYPLVDVADRLQHWKTARNALIGITRSRSVWGIKGDRRSKLFTANPYLSPGLWATCQDILHYIAWQAITQGAIYVNTDGYIFPAGEQGRVWFENMLTDIGLDYKVEGEGPGEIRCWGAYQVGEKSTKSFRLKLTHSSKEFTNVQPPKYGKWPEYLRKCQRLVRHQCDSAN